jgi:hypothetical protein
LILGFVPVLLAGTMALASPLPALAANGVAETVTTTYVVNTAKSEIDVTVSLSIKGTQAPTVAMVPCPYYGTCPQTTNYYSNTDYIYVDALAGTVKATSNAGAAKQTVTGTTVSSRSIKLTYPAVGYGQTRVVTVTYAIPSAPASPGGFRALKAYASLCAFGNDGSTSTDSHALNVQVPDGFDVTFISGTTLSESGDANGMQTYGSGTIPASQALWTCLQATNTSGLIEKSVAVGSRSFVLLAWPEDPSWASMVGSSIENDVPKLEELTGLSVPGGITIIEAGNLQLGGPYGWSYDQQAKMAIVVEGATQASIAETMASTVYYPLFADFWAANGLAQYSEKIAGAGQYTPCTDPGPYPGTGSPNLTTWQQLNFKSTDADRSVSDWQYAASCYLMTKLADTIGPDNLKAVLAAASNGEIAYVGAPPAEKVTIAGPISAKNLLDLIDERGMVPAGVTDLDQAQKLVTGYSIFTTAELDARSQARAAYHSLVAAAGGWKMPLAIRSPMATWDFQAAQTAMDTATQILTLRDQAAKNLPGLSLDGTTLQAMFESASTQSDLAAVLNLAKNEADAAAKVGQATQLDDGSHSILQTIGLIGADLSAPLAQANTALKNVKPGDASTSAQTVIDAVNGSSDQGLMRVAVLIGLLLAVLLLVLFLRRRRRSAVLVLAPADGQLDAAAMPPPLAAEAGSWASYSPPAQHEGAPETSVLTAVAPPPRNEGAVWASALPPVPPGSAPVSPTLAERLRQLQEAHDAGLLSDDEFNAKRNELLQGL